MEGASLHLCSRSPCASLTKPNLVIIQRFSFPSSIINHTYFPKFLPKFVNKSSSLFSPRNSSSSSTVVPDKASVLEKTDKSLAFFPKIDKTGKFCSPRAARELALSILYAACLEGLDPVRLFEKRMNARLGAGYGFDKKKLMEYNPMSFGGPPMKVESDEEANELLRNIEKESAIEAEVLTAPPKLVYNKLMLRFSRKLLVAVRDRWDSHVVVINEIVPANWKNEPSGKILELSILHLAMSEMTGLETRHEIVINEAVDLAKRFCDGAAPRIINGCLRTFVQGLELGASDNALS